MSRVGKNPVPIPDGVTVGLRDGVLAVEGPQGRLELPLSPLIRVDIDEAAKEIRVGPTESGPVRTREARRQRSLWGTTRRLIANMVHGVTQGYTRRLQVVGVGYTARIEGQELVLRVGFANELRLSIPDGLRVDPPEAGNLMITGVGQVPCTTITVHSADKQQVGQFAAAVRRLRPPEPYKGKGIRYEGEEVKRKAGKALAGTTA